MRTLETPDLKVEKVAGLVKDWGASLREAEISLRVAGSSGLHFENSFNQEIYKVVLEACRTYKLALYAATSGNLYLRTTV